MITDETLMTAADVGALLKIHRQNVYPLVNAGAFPYIKIGNRTRFRRTYVEAYLKRQTQAGPIGQSGLKRKPPLYSPTVTTQWHSHSTYRYDGACNG